MNQLNLAEIQDLYQDLYVNRKTIDDVSSVSEVKYEVKSRLNEEQRHTYEQKVMRQYEMVNLQYY